MEAPCMRPSGVQRFDTGASADRSSRSRVRPRMSTISCPGARPPFCRYSGLALACACTRASCGSSPASASTRWRREEAIYCSKLQTSENIEQGAKVMTLFLDPGIDGHDGLYYRARSGSCPAAGGAPRTAVSSPRGRWRPGRGRVRWREINAIMSKVKRNRRPLLRFLPLQGTPIFSVLWSAP